MVGERKMERRRKAERVNKAMECDILEEEEKSKKGSVFVGEA